MSRKSSGVRRQGRRSAAKAPCVAVVTRDDLERAAGHSPELDELADLIREAAELLRRELAR